MKILIVLPAYNEEIVVAKNTLAVLAFCQKNLSDDFSIVIADNRSSDRTPEISRELATREPNKIFYERFEEKGKGLAWRQTFLKYEADIYIVMDIDLAVELTAVIDLIAAIKAGADLAVGSRYLKESKIERTYLRDLTSLVYRSLAKAFLRSRLSDFQCGFKGINRRLRDEVLPQTQDNLFFLDTEISILSEKLGYRVQEVPVNWSEFRDLKRKSTVKVAKTVFEYFYKLWQLKKRLGLKKIKN